jgi:hypothetical protein
MSNWNASSSSSATFPKYNPALISKGIGFSTGVTKKNKNGFNSMAKIYNRTAAGAIYEQAGVKNPQGQPWVGPNGPAGNRYSHSRNPRAGEQFIGALPPLSGSLKGRGRLIFKAWTADKGRAEGIVNKAISTAEQELVKRSRSRTLGKAA